MTTPVSITGKANVWAAINTWLSTNIPASLGFTYNFDQALDPAVMPRVDVSEFKYFDPGDTALGGEIFPANYGLGPTQGKEQRMMVELNIRTDGSQSASALQFARQLRDYFIYAITNSGVADNDSGTVLVPPIHVLDLGNSSADTNIVCRIMTEVDNAVIENFFQTQPPETLIFRYQIFFRVEWYEMR